eukprot:6460496-Amphidinium_carterae.1
MGNGRARNVRLERLRSGGAMKGEVEESSNEQKKGERGSKVSRVKHKMRVAYTADIARSSPRNTSHRHKHVLSLGACARWR